MANSNKRRSARRAAAYAASIAVGQELLNMASAARSQELAMLDAAKPCSDSERQIARGLAMAKAMEKPDGYTPPMTVSEVKQGRGKTMRQSPSTTLRYNIQMEIGRGLRTRYYKAMRNTPL